MTINKIDIDLRKFRGSKSTIFTGRPQGVEARNELLLDQLDKKRDTEVFFIIPGDTTSFNPSFYLGLLFGSYKSLGETEFQKKYHFEIDSNDPETKRILQKNLDDAHTSALISLNRKNPFAFFL